MLKRAIHCFSISNLLYILLSPLLKTIGEKYGNFSFEHWAISFLVWTFCVLSVYFVLKLDDWIEEK